MREWKLLLCLQEIFSFLWCCKGHKSRMYHSFCFACTHFFSLMLKYAFGDMGSGVKFHFRPSGGLLKHQCFNAKILLCSSLIHDPRFAAYTLLVVTSLEETQELLSWFSIACKSFGFTINIKKMVVIHQLCPILKQILGVWSCDYWLKIPLTLLYRLMGKIWRIWSYLHILTVKLTRVLPLMMKLLEVKNFLMPLQFCSAGHVIRISDEGIPKVLMHSQLDSGRKNVGHPWLRWKDKLKNNISVVSFAHNIFE